MKYAHDDTVTSADHKSRSSSRLIDSSVHQNWQFFLNKKPHEQLLKTKSGQKFLRMVPEKKKLFPKVAYERTRYQRKGKTHFKLLLGEIALNNYPSIRMNTFKRVLHEKIC